MKIPIVCFLVFALLMLFIGFCIGNLPDEKHEEISVARLLTMSQEEIGCLPASMAGDIIDMLIQHIRNGKNNEIVKTHVSEDSLLGIIIQEKDADKPKELLFIRPKKINFSAMDEAIKILTSNNPYFQKR